MQRKGKLCFLGLKTEIVGNSDFTARDFEGGYKPIEVLPDGTMRLLSTDMIGKKTKFFKPVVLNYEAAIKTGDMYAATTKGYIYKSENDFGNLSTRYVVVGLPHELSDQQIEDILSGKLKHGDEVII